MTPGAGVQGQAEASTQELLLLRMRPGWARAVASLRMLAERHGDAARAAARDYGQVYAGCRGAMVFDVIASRRRNYTGRVLPMVRRWGESVAAPTLATLAADPPDPATFGLQASEPGTMRTFAANLLALTEDAVSEDDACKTWASSVQALEHAHNLDPVVGGVHGVGPALFAYMRMRCGAQALKPDVRVAAALRQLGFDTPGDQHSILTVARAAAAEARLDLLELDQLLWMRRD